MNKFLGSGVCPSQIGVITPYEGQRAFLTLQMRHSASAGVTGGAATAVGAAAEVEIASVDAFQVRSTNYQI